MSKGKDMSLGGAAAVELFMRPRSVAIIGVSSKPGSAGMNAYNNFSTNKYAGDIHLVGRSGGTIDGRPVLTDIDQLPEGVDLAIFTLPAAGVKEAMEGCVRRKVKAATIFASGFAEVGERAKQDELAAIARDGGVALLGPNCLGYTNFINGITAGFVNVTQVARITAEPRSTTAIISQSGGLMAHIRMGLEQRDIPVGYNVSTGNEAGVGLADLVDFFVADEVTGCIVIYTEEVRKPAEFLAAARRAMAAGKPVLMMHPGSGEAAREAVNSHTGALAGDHAVMRTLVTHAGILFVDTIDEMVDSAEIAARFPKSPVNGPGILTFSGAFCAIAHDFCEKLDLDVPPMSAPQVAELRKVLPSFATPRNPLDLTTQPVFQPELMYHGAKALLEDPALGSLVISIPIGPPVLAMKYLNGLLQAMEGNTRPVVFSILGERSPLPQEFVDLAKQKKLIISRSAERSLRAMAQVTFHGRAIERAKMTVDAKPIAGLPEFGKGTQAEWVGKLALKAAGIRIPDGDLARTADEAVAVAARIGYPVVMKAQAAKLAHKTEAGGVLLNIADEAGVRKAWTTLHENVGRYQAGLKLDGVLVEKMSSKGLELVVGARRDAAWGPVVVVGVGGTLVEAIGDVRLLPPDLSKEAIVKELYKLKTAKLLDGFRGAPAVDVDAVAEVAVKIGNLMRTVPEITEIDVNPVFAHPRGQGVTALDALIVTKE
ncbi:acetate--CoA ligase family protein [Roseiarcaceae bacterium H3SJ34-1]|uniref:acetate--CoA ligase family protein n=1 Tax=Terripilifer ovatus TaxID=3032367 RepID=UPI003AB97ABE|nr:acetate--CoA ligase family protein [Roseiarcaceae bacterium H3SJ34-1]